MTKSSILPATAGPGAPGSLTADEERWMKEEAQWSTSIPEPLLAFGEATESEDATFEAHEEHNRKLVEQGMDPLPPPNDQELPSHIMSKNFAPPPQLPAQLNRGVLNFAVAQSVGSGDDNSILPKPDHTVIDHLAASPISKGLLSVGVTKRYRRKVSSFSLLKRGTLLNLGLTHSLSRRCCTSLCPLVEKHIMSLCFSLFIPVFVLSVCKST